MSRAEAERHSPSLLMVGPVTWDVFGTERRPGGAVAYGARAAAALGVRARVLVLAGADASLDAFCGHEVAVVESDATLTFAHDLEGSTRRLRVVARPGRALVAADLPAGWEDSDILALGPLLASDIDVESFASLPVRRRGLLAQGLLREISADGHVTHARAPSPALLEAVDERTSVFVSQEEIAAWDERALAALVETAERVVVTRGERGAEVYCGSERVVVESPAAASRDVTGAGDVFAVGFMIALANGGTDAEAGRVGAELAAASVERIGAVTLPSVEGAVP